MGYQFNRLQDHYNKHVCGNDKNDCRAAFIKKRESDQWQNYRKIKDKQEYKDAAENNIYVSKRIYNHITSNGISKNYQKEPIKYKNKMTYEEFEGLLTTCVGQDKFYRTTNLITTCFYKTPSFKNIELLSMALSIYFSGKCIVKTTNNVYIPGFNLNTFNDEYKNSFTEIYSERPSMDKYNDRLYLKRFLMEFLIRNIEIYNKNNYHNSWEDRFFVILQDVIKKWIKCYNDKQSFLPSNYCEDDYKKIEQLRIIIEQIDNDEPDYDIYPEIKVLLKEIVGTRSSLERGVIIELFSINITEYEL